MEYSVIYWSVVYWISYNVISWSEAIFKSPKIIRTLVFYLFWHHNGMYFFDILIFKSGPTLIYFLHFDLRNVLRATTTCNFSTFWLLKVARICDVWYILTWKYILCHNGVYFFDILISKSGAMMWSLIYFDLEIYISRYNGVHFFDISISKSGANMWRLEILTWKCISRHNGVYFFDIVTSKSGPILVYFIYFDFEMWFTS